MVPTPSPRPTTPAPAASRGRSLAAGLVLLTLALSWLATRNLNHPRYPMDLGAALRGVREVLPATARAALVVWLLLLVGLPSITRWLRRRADDLSIAEAAVGAVVLLWGGAYAALLTLGPLGLYRPLVLDATFAAAVLASILTARRRRSAERFARRRSHAGAWLAVLAVALSIGPILLLQLASPVSPFMDVLPYVASVQKIVAFRFYDPFANDAAGVWAPSRQVAGCDALFSFFGIVSGVPGNLAITSLIVPLAILQITALYLLGRSIGGDLAGGLASLFFLTTFVWRRTPDGRGTALAFLLVAIGLVFLVGRRRSALRTALGGLALGLAVTVNPLIGACGMQVATAAIVVTWIDLGLPIIAPVVALAGGSVLALPQVLIGLGMRVHLVLLPLAVAGGALLIALAGRIAARTHAGRRAPPPRRAWPIARLVSIVGLLLYVLWIHAMHSSSFFGDDWFGYSILLLLAAGGLIAGAFTVWRHPARFPAAAVPALAFAVALLDYTIADPRRFAGPLAMRSLAAEVTSKMVYYWTPYWAAIGTGVLFALLARRGTRLPAIAFALLIVVYPLRHTAEPLDYDTAQLTVAENWAFNLANAARGYFAGQPDRRWVLDQHWDEVANVLRAEMAAGRIGYATHVLTISTAIDTIEPALGAGVSIDLVTPQFDPQSIWNVGGRVRGRDALPAALAARPPYILLQDEEPAQFPELADYEQIFDSQRTRLYRRRAAPAT